MREKLRSFVYTSTGHALLVVGVVGMFIPVFPSTPFVVMAVVCYERGSSRFHVFLVEHKYIGPHLQNWQENRSIPLYVKIMSTSMIAVGITWTWFTVPSFWAKFLFTLVGASVAAYLLTRPTAPRIKKHTPMILLETDQV